MQQSFRVTAFTVSELLGENQRDRKEVKLPPPPRLGLKCFIYVFIFSIFFQLKRYCYIQNYVKTLFEFVLKEI